MNKKLYVLTVTDDCVYQESIVGIFSTKEDAEKIIERISNNENSDIGHAWLAVKEFEINTIDEELLNYNNLFL